MSVVVATGFTGDTYPLTHGRVCWEWYKDATPSATTAAAGFPAVNAMPPRTDSAWRPTEIPSNWSLDFATDDSPVGFVGIAKHDLGTLNATIAIEYDIDGVWTAFAGAGSLQPTDDSPILLLVPETDCDGVRIRITAADGNPTIAVIMVGVADEWPRPFTWTGSPITEGDRIRFENTIAVTGNWLGRSVAAEGIQFSVQMQHASEAWRQGDFARFKRYANGQDAVFFIALRPSSYPAEVAYAWATDVVAAQRAIANKSISTTVEMTCQGLRPARV
jgi:hypothetical protein